MDPIALHRLGKHRAAAATSDGGWISRMLTLSPFAISWFKQVVQVCTRGGEYSSAFTGYHRLAGRSQGSQETPQSGMGRSASLYQTRLGLDLGGTLA